MDEMQTTVSAEEPSFSITLDESANVFVATKDGVEFGGVLFAEKDDRVLLLATSILPEFRGQGWPRRSHEGCSTCSTQRARA